MTRAATESLLHHLRRLAGRPAPEAPTDGQLLKRLVADRDADAFDLLVQRHGAMVLSVTRRVLRDAHAAEDVFQATFLVLARKAGSVRRAASLGSWLHGVARRLAVRADRRRAAQPLTPDAAERPALADPAADLSWREFLDVLDEELDRLP